MRKSPIVIFLVYCLFIGLPSFGLAYNTQTTHPYLTKFAIELYNQNFPQRTITKEEQQWLIKGSIDEDKGLRKINHFYDPVFNETWKLGGTEYVIPALTAKEWSQNPLAQSFYDPVYLSVLGSIAKGIIFKKWSPYNPVYWSALVSFVSSPARSKSNYTWQRALYEYAKGNKRMAFESLGHILHLIQDMGMPSHTRENVSLPFLKGAVDPYEVYTNRSDAAFYSFLEKKIKNKRSLSKRTLNNYFDYLALYSNKYFYSADTIAVARYSHPNVAFPDVSEIDGGLRKVYLLGRDEKGQLFHLARKKLSWRVQSGFNNYTITDGKVLQDYWERLAPQAVLTSAGVINLFFQKAAEAKNDPDFIASNERSKLDTLLGSAGSLFGKLFKRNPNYVLVKNDYPSSTLVSNSVSSPEKFPQGTTSTTSRRTKKTEVSLITSTTPTTPTTPTTKSPITTTVTSPVVTTSTTRKNISFCSYPTHSFALRNKVIINEVAWMGSKESAADEWIELKNISSSAVDISNWQLISQKGSIKFVFPQGLKIEAGKFLLLERTDDNSVPSVRADFIYSGSLANSNDGLHLFDDHCQLQDEVLAIPNWPAGNNSSKRTMERGSDFGWYDYQGNRSNGIYGTPRRENSRPPITSSNNGSSASISSSVTTTTSPTTTSTTIPQTTTTNTTVTTTTIIPTTTTITTTTTTTTVPPSPLLITEIKAAGKDEEGKVLAHDEFVEIYNPAEEDIDLSGYYLQKKTASGKSITTLLSPDSLQGKVISPHSFFLAGHPESPSSSSLNAVWSSEGSVTDDNTIILKDSSGRIVDKVGWGKAQDCEGDCAPTFTAGQSIQRRIKEEGFEDTNNNYSDFAVEDCPSPGSREGSCPSLPPEEQSINADSFHNFSWHPFTENGSRIVLEFDVDKYPFIPATEHTDNIFTAMAFYFDQDVPGSESFASSPAYISATKNIWDIESNNENNALLVSYPSYYSNSTELGSIIFTSSGSQAAGSGTPRKYSYQVESLPKDNHFIVDIKGVTKGNVHSFSENDYITIGLYAQAGNYLRLVGFDNHKYYFQPDKFYHHPSQVKNFSVSLAKDSIVDSVVSSSTTNPLIYFSWAPSSDKDNDNLSYEIHYVFAREGDSLSDNDLTRNSWAWSYTQSVFGSPVLNEADNKFTLNTSLADLHNLSWPVSATTTIYWAVRAKDHLSLLSPLSSIPQLTLFPSPPSQ